jgi:hypothetical protein
MSYRRSLYEWSENQDIQHEIYQSLKSSKLLTSSVSTEITKWYQILKKDETFVFPSLLSTSFQSNQIPRVDYEIMKAIYLFLKSKLLLISSSPGKGRVTEQMISFNLEVIFKKVIKKMNNLTIPLKQQLELSLLWSYSHPPLTRHPSNFCSFLGELYHCFSNLMIFMI